MDFLKWYKNKVESNDLEPPELIWENIQDELDITHSWHVINDYLTQKSAAKRNYILAMAASLLVLISIGTYIFLKPDQKRLEFQSLVEKVIESEKDNLKTELKSNNQLIAIKKQQDNLKYYKPANTKNLLAENITSEEILIDKNKNIEEKDIANKTVLTKLENREYVFYTDFNNNIRFTEQVKNEVVNTKEGTTFKKLYIGLTGQLANTWILNNKTYNGLESSSLITSNASFGSNFGIFVGTNLTKNIDFQLDVNILAQNNQSYNEYVNGHYIENNLTFNYSQIALSGRYYFISKRFLQGEHGVSLGTYLGYLKNAYQVLDKESINLTSNYNSLDYGLFISYEYLIPIYKQLGFGTGVKAYYGLQNIYSGDEFIPSYMNKTNNASVNISFSIRYSIK